MVTKKGVFMEREYSGLEGLYNEEQIRPKLSGPDSWKEGKRSVYPVDI